jgi:hypothetical protein
MADSRKVLPKDVHEAARSLALEYGVERLAAETGTPPGTIYNKINTHGGPEAHHKPTLADALIWQRLSGDHRILHAEAQTLGEVCFPLPDLSQVSDAALLELLTKVGAEGGDFHRAINSALSDGRFTRKEIVSIRKEGFEFIAAIAEAMERMEGLVDE